MADQNIVAGRNRLSKAVHRMTDRRPGLAGTRTAYQPSLYDTLAADLAGTQGDSRTPAKSMPPCWLDAVQVKADIDNVTYRWWPQPSSTTARLLILADQKWRPDDTTHVLAMAKTIESWCDTITALLDPIPVKTVFAPCPNCGTKHVYRQHNGEEVRQPALQLVAHTGCTCQACKTHWPPDKYQFLARLLGFQPPEGVEYAGS